MFDFDNSLFTYSEYNLLFDCLQDRQEKLLSRLRSKVKFFKSSDFGSRHYNWALRNIRYSLSQLEQLDLLVDKLGMRDLADSSEDWESYDYVDKTVLSALDEQFKRDLV